MKLKLVNKKDEVSGIKSFFWKPETPVNYLPGQYYYFTLPKLNYEDPRGNVRHFTLSSSPTEGTLLRLTTRIRPESGYKKTLDELPIGTEVEGQGPNGVFYFDENTDGNHVFIAGGIGITPFRSMIKFALEQKLDVNMNLIYSNSTVEEIVFKDELEQLAKKYPNFKLNIIITSLVGRIDEKLVKKLTKDIVKPIFWFCGPPTFVTAMEDVLSKLKIPPERIKSEKFTGY